MGLAAATAEVHGPETGLHELAQLPDAVTGDYQPFWALKAQLLQQLGTDRHATETAFWPAIGLTEDGAVRAYIIGKSTQQAGLATGQAMSLYSLGLRPAASML